MTVYAEVHTQVEDGSVRVHKRPVSATVEAVPVTLNVPARLILRTEASNERGKIENLFPCDQRKLCEVFWDGRDLIVLERARVGPTGAGEAEQIAPNVKAEMEGLRKLSVKDLQTRAAELSLKWDKSVSSETMLERLAEKVVGSK